MRMSDVFSEHIIDEAGRRLRLGLEISTCVKRPISAVLWISGMPFVMGANGPPLCFKEYCIPCPRMDSPSGMDMEICPAVHGEMAAILNAARSGIITEGSVLFMSCGLPCKDCMKEIIAAGVKHIVSPYAFDWVEREDKFRNADVYNFKLSYEMMVRCGVEYHHVPGLMEER